MSAKDWLMLNKYSEVLAQIAKLEARWKQAGKGTRKSWWDILSGGKNGAPISVEGEIFPVLRAAQVRLGKAITKNAIAKRREVPPPLKVAQARWSASKPVPIESTRQLNAQRTHRKI